MKYRKKPLTIEAVRWNGCNAQQIRDFVGDCVSFDKVREEDSDAGIPGWIDCTLHLSDCDIMVNIGDFIIKDGNGAFCACQSDEFKRKYEFVEDGNLDEEALEAACDAYCKVCGHYHHTVPAHICRQACDYYAKFRGELKKQLKTNNKPQSYGEKDKN